MRSWRILFILLLFSASGCFAHTVQSPMLAVSEHPEITTRLKNVILAVESPKDESNRYMIDSVIKHLGQTGLFQEVGYREKLTRAPDLILTSLKIDKTDFMKACSLGFEGGMITIGTIGLIPQICHFNHVITFQLSGLGSERKVDITLSYESGGVMGWVAIAYNLSSEWTWMPQPQEKKRNHVWKAAFWEEGDEILEILR